MSDDRSARLGLPLLHAGQAQKEIDHNEALALLDIAVQPAVGAVGVNVPPTAPTEGACWIVGAAPVGAWAGQAQAIAGWTAGGWRFVPARAGMMVWSIGDARHAQHDGTGWTIGTVAASRITIGGVQVLGAQRPAIAAPAGGATADAEARSAIAAILGALRLHGLIAT